MEIQSIVIYVKYSYGFFGFAKKKKDFEVGKKIVNLQIEIDLALDPNQFERV